LFPIVDYRKMALGCFPTTGDIPMQKVRVLVTMTSEAVVEISDDETNVDGFLREHVSLSWGDVLVERIVAEDVSVAFYPVEEPSADVPTNIPLPFGEEAVAAPAADEVVAEEASVLEESAEPDSTEEVHAALDTSADISENQPAQTSTQIVETYIESIPVAARDDESSGPRKLTSHETLSLFTDPIYADMMRAAIRDRAVKTLELVVAEVVSELEPLIRRQTERRRITGA